MNTNTNIKIQDNSSDTVDRNEIIYHIDPEGVIKLNPELEGKVFRSFLLCTMCHQYKKMTQSNSYCIPLSERRWDKEYYIYPNASCMETKCIEKHDNFYRIKNK